MRLSDEQSAPSRRFISLTAVMALHVFLVYALTSGLARDAVEIVKRPLETKLIVELPPLPPPPPPLPKEIVKPQQAPQAEAPPPPAFVPPPEVSTPPSAGPALQATDVAPPAAPVEIKPPIEIPAAPPKPERLSVEGSCPGHADVLRRAFAGLYDKHEIAGTVTVRVQVRGSVITQVSVLSGPREYHRAVLAAVGTLHCQVSSGAEGYFDLPIVFRES